jgi:hypothetical protein
MARKMIVRASASMSAPLSWPVRVRARQREDDKGGSGGGKSGGGRQLAPGHWSTI